MSNCNECGSNSPEKESLPSQVGNFIKSFFGAVTPVQGDTEDTVVWQLPCDMDQPEPIPGFPREENEGIGCYILRYFKAGVAGLAGADAYAVVTEAYIQPAVLDTVEVSVSLTDCFAVGQYVWNESGGFYVVVSVGSGTITLQSLYDDEYNLTPGATISAGTKVLPSGVPETSGPQGVAGPTGPVGPQGPATAWRNGNDVPDNALGADGDYYIRNDYGTVYRRIAGAYVLQTTITGATGPQGPAGDSPTRFWKFTEPGEHWWVAPAAATPYQVRIRVTGAGGGGGGGDASAPGPGFGAGGGEYADATYTVTGGLTYKIFVGQGGLGGSGGDNTAAGVDGTESYFFDSPTKVLEAKGGKGGGAGDGGAEGDGGTGGAGSALNRFSGAKGALARGGVAGREGAGGLPDGGDGESPGGGGGGGQSGDNPGGDGGNGCVVIEIAAT